MSASPPARVRFSFLAKSLAAAGIVVLADRLFFAHEKGWTVGLFALAWTGAAIIVQRQLRRRSTAWIPLALAIALAALQIENPTLLVWVLFWTALTTAVLLPRTSGFGDAWRFGQRLAFHVLAGCIRPFRDIIKLNRVRIASQPRVRALIAILALPLVGGAIFLALFARANPLIGDTLYRLHAPDLGPDLFWRLVFAGVVAVSVWTAFRPKILRRPFAIPIGRGDKPLPGVSALSVILSLGLFNAIFALQNVLDIAFLWSNAPLPGDMTMAGYAHRGAYPLMVTALLAGVFVLVTLRPGSQTAKRPLVRWLVGAWVAQNLVLVASSILRTLNYVDSYSLTRFRIAAIVWMALVGLGLALILWRMLRGKSAAWLLNTNALAAAVVLVAASVLDLGGMAAAWNVTHASEVGGNGVELDLCYLYRLSPSALVPLARLEARPSLGPDFRRNVAEVRRDIEWPMRSRLDDWRAWTWRDARRLDNPAVQALPRPSDPGEPYCSGD